MATSALVTYHTVTMSTCAEGVANCRVGCGVTLAFAPVIIKLTVVAHARFGYSVVSRVRKRRMPSSFYNGTDARKSKRNTTQSAT